MSNNGYYNYPNNPLTQIILSPITASSNSDSRYGPVTINLLDHSTYNLAGQGGWQIVDRPKMVAATQWFDRSPYQLVFDGLLDKQNVYVSDIQYQSVAIAKAANARHKNPVKKKITTPPTQHPPFQSSPGDQTQATQSVNIGASVEDYCASLEYWMEKVNGTFEPPILRINGPVPGTQRVWALYGIEFSDAIRDFDGGFRTQQKVKITLYEYVPPLQNVFSSYSQKFLDNISQLAGVLAPSNDNLNGGAQQYIMYTVQEGDTVYSIANKFGLTNSASIARINNIRDVSTIYVGQILNIPRT